MSRSKGPLLTCRECGHLDETARAGAKCPTCAVVLVPAKVLKRSPKDPVLGRVVGGKYAVVSVLGVGGFGAVYRAVQEPVGRHVALKVVHAKHVEDAEMRARFFREAKVVAQLSDPAVVTLFDYGEEPGIGLYMVFELIGGRNLGQILKEGPQDSVWLAHVLLQTLRALNEAHGLGMVHRDIKPANIMVVEQKGHQSVRLLDFGIAKVAPAENREATLQTREGLMLGTPQYMSPEQVKTSSDIDGRCDLYSLGVVAYAALLGKNPYERESVVETVMAHVADPPPALPADLHVPAAFEAVLQRAVQKDPGERFASAPEMSEAICAAFPHVAFPSLSYEFRAAPARSEPSLLGIALDGSLTPTPSGQSVPMALAEPAVVSAGLPALPPPEVSSDPATLAHATNLSAARPSPSLPMMLGAALLLLALLLVGGLWLRPTMPAPEPLESPSAAFAPLPEAPVARAVALVASGQSDTAANSLANALSQVQSGARSALFKEAESEASLKPLLARPLLRALRPVPQLKARPELAPKPSSPAQPVLRARPKPAPVLRAPPVAKPTPAAKPRPTPTAKPKLDVPEF